MVSQADVMRASDQARQAARAIGFSSSECEDIALVMSELASNLVKHAGGGVLSLTPLSVDQRNGIQIESIDTGPGITDVELALTDGFSTRGGLGNGLGTVNRLMDRLEFESKPGSLRILCQRWVRPSGKGVSMRRVNCGAVTRPRRGTSENGDAIVIRQWTDHALVGVIDGLGHGPLARKASMAARHYVETHFDQPLEDLFRGVGRACRATRGVVMGLARFDLARSAVAVAGIGNVEVRLADGSNKSRFVMRRGVLGMQAPEPLITEREWTRGAVLIAHSDGIASQWSWNDYAHLAAQGPVRIARKLLEALGKFEDDATVLVAANPAL
ncbi:MAG TPA: ATP-binding protein [Verrucomicrobiae bacterium]|nr:ATP-binding protein [Verrucomicrobiae bacterium]